MPADLRFLVAMASGLHLILGTLRVIRAKARINPESCGALLVPIIAGHPTTEGDIAKILGDILCAATDLDYRARVANRTTRRTKTIGRQLAELGEARGLTQKAVAQRTGLKEWQIVGIESGRLEASSTAIAIMVEAMGADLQDVHGVKVGLATRGERAN
jgi:hypothetical protein